MCLTLCRAAASSVGGVVGCDEDRMQAFAELAMDVFGEVSDWSTVDVATVGNMIGMMTRSVGNKD